MQHDVKIAQYILSITDIISYYHHLYLKIFFDILRQLCIGSIGYYFLLGTSLLAGSFNKGIQW